MHIWKIVRTLNIHFRSIYCQFYLAWCIPRASSEWCIDVPLTHWIRWVHPSPQRRQTFGVLASCAVFPPPSVFFSSFFLPLPFSLLLSSSPPFCPVLLIVASKHLRLSHLVLNAGEGVIKWMNKPAASSQDFLTKYRIVSSAETCPDIWLRPLPFSFFLFFFKVLSREGLWCGHVNKSTWTRCWPGLARLVRVGMSQV